MAHPFEIEAVFKAPSQKVWKAITDKDEMKNWYFNLADFKPEPGFEFRFKGGKDPDHQYTHVCKIIEVSAGKKLAYSWTYEGYQGYTIVTLDISEEGVNTRLKLTHEGLETFPDNVPDFARENFAQGWNYIIGTSLKEYLEK
ncbi:SRPBCC family protein [Sporocytophaga myxococcoides]|uniref:SRPBCC family protein n=1 Tax=Sporocytophaga myxococcoides TaxID=153721 RepID=UPI0004185F72|nr:SRPBCC domain-containing protein [Sporocytophaga myxococcoides]